MKLFGKKVKIRVKRDKKEIDKKEITKNLLFKAVIFLVFIGISVLLFPRGKSYQYADYKVGTVADKEIIAPFDFPILKTDQELEQEKQEVLNTVYPHFFMNLRIYERQIAEYDNFFEPVYEIHLLQMKALEKERSLKKKTGKQKEEIILTYVVQLDSLKKVFKDIYQIDLNKKEWESFLSLKKESIDKFKINVKEVLSDITSSGIIDKTKDDYSLDAKILFKYKDKEEVHSIHDFLDEKEAKENASKRLRSLYSAENNIVNAGYELLNLFIYPNIIYDEELTEKRKSEALSKIPLARGVVLKEQRIVDSHEIITDEIYTKIRSLRVKMYEEGTARGFFGLVHYIGKALFICLLLFVMFIYVFIYMKSLFYDNKKTILILSIILIEFIFASAIYRFGFSEYIIPTTIASLLFAILFDSRIGYVGTIVVALGLAGMMGSEFTLGIVSVITGLVAVYSVYKVRQRSQFFRSIFFIFFTYVIALVTMGLFKFAPFEIILEDILYYALPNSIISPIITIGMLYIFEWGFGITTNMRLLELSDLNRPVLRELAIKAPGSYQHSIVAGNLAEEAADAIGANSLLARVGAYYHDIGKMIKPEYYTENQTGTNPHDKLAPSMSCLIIASHVKEGVELGKKYKLPEKILDLIRQHQGTGNVSFFYELAVKQTDPKHLNEMDFRYPGPKPQTKEAGILMLADSAEATSKSLKNPSVPRLREMVAALIESKFKDGQLDECELTFKDLSLISDSFIKVLISMFHTRLEYPAQSKEPSNKEKMMEKVANNKDSNDKENVSDSL